MAEIQIFSQDAIQKLSAEYERLYAEIRNTERRLRAHMAAITDGTGFVGYASAAITARSGTTPGSGTVQPKCLSGGLLVDNGPTETVYSWASSASQSGVYVFCTYDKYGTLWFTGEDC